MTRRRLLPGACAALFALGTNAGFSPVAGAAEAQVSARAETHTGEADAPGRSSVPAPAFAVSPRREHRTDFSPQNMAFELRFGPYLPRVDESQGLFPPQFKSFFGDKTRYQLGFEVDWQAWRAPRVGTLGLGAGWSYTRDAGANKLPDGMVSDGTPIAQKTSLSIMPMYAVGVLRVDVLARELSIPLVGYGKFGLAYARWWMSNGRGTAYSKPEDPSGKQIAGRDVSIGTQAALGAMFLLDWLEPSAGTELDASMGINNSYIFFEYSVSNYGGAQMNVGSKNWVTGLAIEM